MVTRLYKTLRDGKSWHGGEHTWSLPTQGADGEWTPGEWTPRVAPEVCEKGWHLTTEPARWWSADAGVACYLAEHDGAVSGNGGDKVSCERVRLLRPLTEDELAAVGIYTRGEHAVSGGIVWAWGSATVRARGPATVWAWGSARVHVGEQSAVIAMRGAGLVLTRSDEGVIIDRRGASPKTYTKRAGLDGWRFRDGKWVRVKVRAKAGAK